MGGSEVLKPKFIILYNDSFYSYLNSNPLIYKLNCQLILKTIWHQLILLISWDLFTIKITQALVKSLMENNNVIQHCKLKISNKFSKTLLIIKKERNKILRNCLRKITLQFVKFTMRCLTLVYQKIQSMIRIRGILILIIAIYAISRSNPYFTLFTAYAITFMAYHSHIISFLGIIA